MDYLELRIDMPKEKVDLVSTFLITGGYEPFEVCDFGDLLENAGIMFSDYIEDELLEKQSEPPCIRFYCDADGKRAREVSEFILGVAQKLGWNDITCTTTLVENSDWDTRWKQYFYPFPVGEKLFIKPTWEETEESAVAGRAVIEIDPAAAFGSGTHATTRLCLEKLEKQIRPGDVVLDMGTGSGILGIGALKLGAGRVDAVDIDEAAARTAGENFLQNACGKDSFRVFCGNVLEENELCEKFQGPYRLITANIVAQVIGLMADFLYSRLEKGGVLIASGILSEREKEVREKLERAGFLFLESEKQEEWVCMCLKKDR